MTGAYPLNDPGASGPHAAWYSANIDAGAVTVQRCSGCGATALPARHMCARCRSMDLEFVATDVAAMLVSWTTSHRALHPGFFEVVPYTIAVIELPVGPRITAVLRDVDHTALTVGAACRVGVDDFGVPYATLS